MRLPARLALLAALLAPCAARAASWERLPDMPTPRIQAAMAATSAGVFVIGGQNERGYRRSVDVFDPVTRRWRGGPPMPTARAGLRACAIGDKIYVAGGRAEAPALGALEVLDTLTGRWSRAAPMPTARSTPGLACLGGKVYVAGGSVGPDVDTAYTDAFERFEPASGRWRRLAPIPHARAYIELAAAAGRVYAVGGSGAVGAGGAGADPGGVYREVDVFEPKTGRWTAGPALPEPTQFHVAEAAQGTIHVVGGWDGGAYITSHLMLGPSGWKRLDPVPARFMASAGTALGDCLYVCGGVVDAHKTGASAAAYRWCEDRQVAVSGPGPRPY